MKLPSLVLTVLTALSGLATSSSPYSPPRAMVRCEAEGPGYFYVHEVVGDLVIMDRSGTIEAHRIEDCSVNWSWKASSPTGDLPALFDGTLYVVDRDDPEVEQFELIAIEAVTGMEKWRAGVDARIGINLHAGVLLVQGVFEIVGIDPNSGAVLWRKQPTTYGSFDPYVFQGGHLFITDVEANQSGFVTNFSALDVRTGELDWSLKLNDAFVPLISTGPQQVAILTVLFEFGKDSAGLTQTQIGIDVLTGDQLWTRNIDLNLDIHILGQSAYATHRPDPDGGLSLIALDVRTGQSVWNAEIPDSVRFVTRYDDPLLVGILDYSQKFAPSPPWRLLAYDIASESIVWTRVLQQNYINELEWEIVDGALVFAEGNTLNAVDIETGDVVWKFSASTVHPAAQIAVGTDIVVVTSFDDPVLFIEPPKFNQ